MQYHPDTQVRYDDLEWSGQVKVFPYRTAKVVGARVDVPRDQASELEAWLADKAGVDKDNQTCYSVTVENGQVMYFWFSDLRCFIGTQLEEECY